MTDTGISVEEATCCDLHGRNCERPYELCCWRCTEADHPEHRNLGPCSNPDLSGPGISLMCECSHHWYVHAASGKTARSKVCHGYTGNATPGPFPPPCICREFKPWAGPRDSRTGAPVRPLSLATDSRVSAQHDDVPVIADERDHMQAAMHLMRDAFVDACQSGVPWEKAGELQGQFFDGYQAAKRAWGDALVKRDVLGKKQRPMTDAKEGPR
jgi:hypothetical protein